MGNNFENLNVQNNTSKVNSKLYLSTVTNNKAIDNTNSQNKTNKNSANNTSLASKLGNVGEATGIGIVDAVPTAIKDITKEFANPSQLISQVATSAAIGAIMKVALPESGIIPLAVGGYFMVNFGISALKPMIKGWGQAWDAKNHAQVHTATSTISSGLGAFGAGTAIGLAGFGLGYKAVDLGGKAILGVDGFKAFEDAKNNFWTSNDSSVGRVLNKSTNFVSSKFKSLGEKFSVKNSQYSDQISAVTTQPDLPIEEKLARIQNMVRHYARDQQNEAIYMLGMVGKDGVPHGFDRTINILSAGLDPTQVAAHDTIPTSNGITAIDKSLSGQGVNEAIGPSPESIKPGNANYGTKLTDKTTTKSVTPNIKSQYDVSVIKGLADASKQLMNRWTIEKQLITDVTQPQVATYYEGLYPPEPLPAGYRPVLPQIDSLRHQIQTPEDLQVVEPLLDGVSKAVSQRGAYNLDQTSKDVNSLNLFGQQIYEGLKKAMVEKGKLSPADVNNILTMKNPSLFLVRSDGTDPLQGQGGQGPYTVPGIHGVLSLDTVYVPRNMSELTSLMADGVYGHELGHDQYGGILKFPQDIREQVIAKTVTNSMTAADYNKPIDVPGVGQLPQGKLIEEIFKAQANENTADMWSSAWTGKNAGFSLGILLQALRGSGQLENRSVFGAPIASEENPLGIEVHAIDKLRPLMVAHAMKVLANKDPLVTSQADALIAYSKAASRPGDYTWFQLPDKSSSGQTSYAVGQDGLVGGANPGTPPPSFSINEALLNNVANSVVEAQLKTPLSSLKGKTFSDILPNLSTQVQHMADLGHQIASAIETGKSPKDLKFNPAQYTMNDVLGAGIDAATELVSHGMNPLKANTMLNEFSGYLRDLYHTQKPGDVSKNWQSTSAYASDALGVIKQQALGKTFTGLGNLIDAAATPIKPSNIIRWTPLTAGASTSLMVQELMNQEQTKRQMFNQSKGG